VVLRHYREKYRLLYRYNSDAINYSDQVPVVLSHLKVTCPGASIYSLVSYSPVLKDKPAAVKIAKLYPFVNKITLTQKTALADPLILHIYQYLVADGVARHI
jgi:hypothetical protein